MKSICVFCGSSDSVHADYRTAAHTMGRILAQRGIRVIYGGGKTGLMGEVANGALSAGGEVIGVIIPSMNTPALAHTGLTRMDIAPDMHGRKARMHELAEGYIALPGGFGTCRFPFATSSRASSCSSSSPPPTSSCRAALARWTNSSRPSPGRRPARMKSQLAC